MDILASYIIKSVIASGILYGYYQVALKNKKFHSYNRGYLLLSIMISLVVPFINSRWFYIEGPGNAPLADFVNSINSPAASQPVSVFTAGSVLFGISALISLLLLVFLASKILWIYRVKRISTNIKMRGFTLVETRVKQAPFSFLSNLFWRQGLSATDTNGEKIFRHELTHIRQKHTYDKLFTQVVFCIFWMNPFYWLIQRELNTIHEFIADAAAVEDGDTESFAEMLLHAHNKGSYLSPSHPFFNSSIKRRLIMISSSSQTQYSYIRRILALPVALFVLALLSVSVKAQTDKKTNFQTVKEVQKPSRDTIPKSATAPATRNPEPVTVTGKKLDKQPAPKSKTVAREKLADRPVGEPVTVIGKKLDKQPAPKPKVVIGEEVYDKKPDPKTKTVTGKKLDKQPVPEPVTVPGKKIR
jgi:hypothetical protein